MNTVLIFLVVSRIIINFMQVHINGLFTCITMKTKRKFINLCGCRSQKITLCKISNLFIERNKSSNL